MLPWGRISCANRLSLFIAFTDEALIDLSEHPDQDSIYFNQLSYFSGKLSAGAAIETCKAVLSRRVKNAIAVIRPPGHHAEPLKPMGFCLFNNVCIASKACQQDPRVGNECRKILVVDWYVLCLCKRKELTRWCPGMSIMVRISGNSSVISRTDFIQAMDARKPFITTRISSISPSTST